MSKNNLHEELIKQGASSEEAAHLAEIAGQLTQLPTPKPLLMLRRGWWTWQRAVMAAGVVVVAVLAGGGLVAMAQISQPDTALYPVKRASETMIMKMDPNFSERVMMRRVTEIDTLVSKQAPYGEVIADVKAYEQVIPKVKLTTADRDYCTDHLVHAISLTSGSERQAIQQALAQMSYAN